MFIVSIEIEILFQVDTYFYVYRQFILPFFILLSEQYSLNAQLMHFTWMFTNMGDFKYILNNIRSRAIIINREKRSSARTILFYFTIILQPFTLLCILKFYIKKETKITF